MSRTFRSHLWLVRSYLPVALVIFLLPLGTGCDGSSGGGATVSGKITFEGKPVTSGLINFMPPKGRPLGGGIQPDGTYHFQLPAGHYQVRIDTPPAMPKGWKEGDPPPKLAKRKVPLKYGGYQSSGLSADVNDQKKSQTIDFELSQ